MPRKKNSGQQISFEEYRLNEVRVKLVLNESSALYGADPIHRPDDAVRLMTEMMKDLDREMFCVINLDTKGTPLNYHIVSMGALDSSVVPVQNVFKTAIIENAGSIIGLHNHPSGSVSPSREDVDVTKRLVAAGQLMGICVLDHIIIGAGYGAQYSFKENRPELFETLKIDANGLLETAVGDWGWGSCGEERAADYDEEFDI